MDKRILLIFIMICIAGTFMAVGISITWYTFPCGVDTCHVGLWRSIRYDNGTFVFNHTVVSLNLKTSIEYSIIAEGLSISCFVMLVGTIICLIYFHTDPYYKYPVMFICIITFIGVCMVLGISLLKVYDNLPVVPKMLAGPYVYSSTVPALLSVLFLSYHAVNVG